MWFFEVLHVEIAQKSQNLEISLIFCHFLIDFQYLPIFLVIFEKKKSKKGPNELKFMSAFRET